MKMMFRSVLLAIGIALLLGNFANAEPGKPHRVTFSNASGRLELAVDGEAVLSCEHPMPEGNLTVSSGAAVSVE